jgi:fumarate reductase flavoprotein subunit
VQRAAGLDDSPEQMLQDYLAINRWRVEPGLARTYCEGAPDVVEWLVGLGLPFGPIVRAGAERVPRGHRAIGEGQALIDVLERACRALGVELAFGNRVDELLVEHGAVVGVRSRGEALRAGAVVLATGGFARNRALLDAHVDAPWIGPPGEPAETLAGPGSRGDALTMGARVDAALAGVGRALWVPQALTPPAVVLVRPDGRRFVDESADFTTAAMAAAEWGGIHYAIFDEVIRRSPRFAAIDKTAAGYLFRDDATNLDDRPLDAWVAAGDLVCADTPAGVAVALGLDPGQLDASVAAYNDACASGRDDRFEKSSASLLPIATPPFYGVRVRPTVLIATFCGLRIDREARVLDRRERPVRGLYAAGEAAGGVVGDVYAGHGNSITSGLVFGRIAGARAATHAR